MIIRVQRNELRHGDGRRLFVYGEHGPVTPLSDGDPPPAGLHLRRDDLTGAWVGVSPARNARPLTTAPGAGQAPCPLCPGGGEVPFPYSSAVFENRFPSLVANPPTSARTGTTESQGRCEVVLYTSEHVGSLATLSPAQLAQVVAVWVDRSDALWAEPEHAHVLVFENRGEEVGATISHPHGQIYAFAEMPPLIRDRIQVLREHRASHDDCLTCGVVTRDEKATDRHVLENPSFTVAVPWAARWPYEVHVRAKRHGLARLGDMTTAERADLAAALRDVVRAYDALYDRPLPYLMTCLEAPNTETGQVQDWHLAFEFLPPNRGPDKLKVRASVETATGFFINDTVPERTATDLVDALASAGGAQDQPVPDVVIDHHAVA